MPIGEHPSFNRPSVTSKLWRYTDLPKFIELMTSGTLWLTNAEILASNDPYEGLPGAIQFPHRMWSTIDEVPEPLRRQILAMRGTEAAGSAESAFKGWFMGEEQRCIMTRSGRRDFYVSCWHLADHESVAMWKIYGSPGAGIAVVSNGGRIEASLAENQESLYLGAVRYNDPTVFTIGTSNAFDSIMAKRSSYSYEQEVRLVHWKTGESHDSLANFNWNEETLRFDDLIQDNRPIRPGLSFACDIDVLIERVVISPFAPPWYGSMIDRLKKRFGFKFPVDRSKLLDNPPELP